MTTPFTIKELELMIEALAARAARHESYGRADPKNADAHDRIAGDMRKVRLKLLRMKARREPPAMIIPLDDPAVLHNTLKEVFGE